jgi:hypothetical protein
MVRDKLHRFIERLKQDDFHRLDEDLKNILCTKVAIKVDQKIKEITNGE